MTHLLCSTGWPASQHTGPHAPTPQRGTLGILVAMELFHYSSWAMQHTLRHKAHSRNAGWAYFSTIKKPSALDEKHSEQHLSFGWEWLPSQSLTCTPADSVPPVICPCRHLLHKGVTASPCCLCRQSLDQIQLLELGPRAGIYCEHQNTLPHLSTAFLLSLRQLAESGFTGQYDPPWPYCENYNMLPHRCLV